MKNLIKKIYKKTLLFRWRRQMQNRKRIRSWTGSDQMMADFYMHFMRDGDLVFDVGANIGNRVKIFLKLRARVVAVEPQKECVRFLRKMFYGQDGLNIEPFALGSREEVSEINIASSNTISSMSDQWIESVKLSGRFRQYSWNRKETIKVITLDHLTRKYGLPRFIKIDVEGYEAEVIKGLTTAVPAISFEYTPEFIGPAIECINYLTNLGNYQFNYGVGETMKLAEERWMSRDEMLEEMKAIDPGSNGDIYARLAGEPDKSGTGKFRQPAHANSL